MAVASPMPRSQCVFTWYWGSYSIFVICPFSVISEIARVYIPPNTPASKEHSNSCSYCSGDMRAFEASSSSASIIFVSLALNTEEYQSFEFLAFSKRSKKALCPAGVPIAISQPFLSDKAGRKTSHIAGGIIAISSTTMPSNLIPRRFW